MSVNERAPEAGEGSWAGRKHFTVSCPLCPQSLLAQHKDFGAAFEPLQRTLSDLQTRVRAENGLQRDLPGKQAQLSRLQVRGLWSLSRLGWVLSAPGSSPLLGSSWPSSGRPPPGT